MAAPEMEKVNYSALVALLTMAQYKNKPNINNILKEYGLSMNTLQDAIFEMRDLLWLDTATGVQLDIIAKILKVFERTDPDDEIFRQDIRTQVSLNTSGTVDELILLLNTIYGATFALYKTNYPAKYYFWTDAVVTVDELEQISAGGVGGARAAPIVSAEGELLVDHNTTPKLIVSLQGGL